MGTESLYWWIDHISTISAVPLAVLGFGFTLWQLKKTRASAQAARHATEQMRQQLRRTNVSSLLPQLSRIEDELDRAVADRSIDRLRFWIATWRWHAGEARTYLSSGAAGEGKLLRSIQASISIGADTRNRIHDLDDAEGLAVLTISLRKAISRVTGELGAISAEQILSVDGGQGNE